MKKPKEMEGDHSKMNVDEMITLENGESYGLLLESILDNGKYFLAVLLDNQEEPTNEFKVFKEISINGDISVTIEDDVEILEKLIKDYTKQMELLED